MALTSQDKELIKLQAREIAFEVSKEVLAAHIKMCPHGKALLVSKWLLVGILAGTSLIGGGGVFAIAKLLTGI